MIGSLFRTGVAALWVGVGAGAAAAPVYRIVDLGGLAAGADYTQAYAINDAGQIAGESADAFGLRAVRWASDGGMQSLDAGSDGVDSSAYAINRAGVAVGREQTAAGTSAVRWTASNKPPQPLGSLGGGFFDVATAINGGGCIAGYSVTPLGLRAFAWSRRTGMVDLGDLPTGDGRSIAYGLNDDEAVVGSSDVQSPRRQTDHAFLWTKAGGMRDIGTLKGLSADDFSEARDINNAGQVVGTSDAAAGGRHAFLWTETGGMRDLGQLPGGSAYSVAMAINDKGQAVGQSDSANGLVAFAWSATGGMRDLNELVDPDDPLRATVHLDMANDINLRGEIVGRATVGSATRAFLLVPLKR